MNEKDKKNESVATQGKEQKSAGLGGMWLAVILLGSVVLIVVIDMMRGQQ